MLVHFSKLDMNYRDSGAVMDAGSPGKLHAGDRMPDILFGLAQERLHDFLRYPAHHLLLASSDHDGAVQVAIALMDRYGSALVCHIVASPDAAISDGARLIGDPNGELKRRLNGEVFLVRPDQMVCHRENALNEANLRGFMETQLVQSSGCSAAGRAALRN